MVFSIQGSQRLRCGISLRAVRSRPTHTKQRSNAGVFSENRRTCGLLRASASADGNRRRHLFNRPLLDLRFVQDGVQVLYYKYSVMVCGMAWEPPWQETEEAE